MNKFDQTYAVFALDQCIFFHYAFITLSCIFGVLNVVRKQGAVWLEIEEEQERNDQGSWRQQLPIPRSLNMD